VFIDRRFSRELPIQPDHVGRWVDSIAGQNVIVEWKESDGRDRVLLQGASAEDTADHIAQGIGP
jgi:pyrimidine operon attenuation protein/uracil phosphoribosyltransferase